MRGINIAIASLSSDESSGRPAEICRLTDWAGLFYLDKLCYIVWRGLSAFLKLSKFIF